MVITTQQKRQLSDLLLRQSFDGQNIEIVTEHRQLGLIVDNKFRWQAQIEHIIMQNCFFFLNCNISSNRYQKYLLQCSHKTSRGLCVSSVGWLWQSTLKRN